MHLIDQMLEKLKAGVYCMVNYVMAHQQSCEME